MSLRPGKAAPGQRRSAPSPLLPVMAGLAVLALGACTPAAPWAPVPLAMAPASPATVPAPEVQPMVTPATITPATITPATITLATITAPTITGPTITPAADPAATYRRGLAYALGQATPRDAARAARCYARAAEAGYARAALLLAQAYATGEGVARDDAAAYRWNLIALALARPQAATALQARRGLRFLDRRLGQASRQAAHAQAASWLAAHPERNSRSRAAR